MSEKSSESPQSSDSSEPSESSEAPEVGLVADEDLPRELRADDDNPLAQDPDAEDDAEDAPEEVEVEGMPDMGQPG